MTIPAPSIPLIDAAPLRLLLLWLRHCETRLTGDAEMDARRERLCVRGEAMGLIDRDGKLVGSSCLHVKEVV